MFLPNVNFVLGHIIPPTFNGHILFGSSPYQHNHTKQKASSIGITTRKIGVIRKTRLIGCYLHTSTEQNCSGRQTTELLPPHINITNSTCLNKAQKNFKELMS